MTEVNTNTFKGPNQGVADGYAPLTIIESGKVDADLTQVKNDLDYHVAVLQSIYDKLDTIATGATPDQDALDIVTRINASAFRIDVKNLDTTVAQLVDITNALNTHIATTTQSAMHNQTSIKSTGLTYSNTPSTVITACNNLLDEIKNVRYQIHRMNGKNTWVDTPDGSLTSLKNSIQSLITDLSAHAANISNPHAVTKAQVGLGNVDNAKQATKTEFDAHAANASAHHARYTDAEAWAAHPTTDGFKHVPANGVGNEGKILTAGALPGQYMWSDMSTVLNLNVTSVSSNYSALPADYTIVCNASAGPVTITLPTASNFGKILNIKKMDSSLNAVIIDGYSAETIDGKATQSIIMQYQSITIQSTGTEWVII